MPAGTIENITVPSIVKELADGSQEHLGPLVQAYQLIWQIVGCHQNGELREKYDKMLEKYPWMEEINPRKGKLTILAVLLVEVRREQQRLLESKLDPCSDTSLN